MTLELQSRIEVTQGDLTKLEVDAIVNAANASLLGGGGVDGAIHRAAGPDLREECRSLGGCATGDAKETNGYQLPADFVVHTVGPVWQDGSQGEAELLASCYRRSLAIAFERQWERIAFPCISTGAFGYPVKQASEIAWETTVAWLKRHEYPHSVIFCCFDSENHSLYESLWNSLSR